MSLQSVRQIGRTGVPGFLVAAALLLVGASDAIAASFKTFPGSYCQASGSAQDLYYSGVAIANRGDNTRSAVCPIVRSQPIAKWSQIGVFVRDRHSNQNITCVAEARDLRGNLVWSQTRSSAGEGEQTLAFGAPGVAVPNFGPYVVVCSIPPMEEVNQPSYISSIVLSEP